MSYLSVISLATAKNYLRVDEDLVEDDCDITRMIVASLQFVENYTNHLVYARNKEYFITHGAKYIDVFDYPINELLTDADTCKPQNFATKRRYYADVELNVGYVEPINVPNGLIEAALQIIKVWYYEHEKRSVESLIPDNIKDTLFQYKRFIIC